jgi:hypothetical protein
MTTTTSALKGTPKTVITNGNHVEIWISSPTGDSSDSHIVHIPCETHEQAEFLANAWLRAWGLDERGNG